MELGSKIKNLRLKNGLTQEELADRCELTKGYISQLENDRNSPSIVALTDVLTALGSNLKEFFSDSDDEPISYGEDDYFVKESESYSMKWLVPTAQKNALEPILLTLEKGGGTDRDMPHEGEEFGYVLSGRIRLAVGKKRESLKAGESFYFRSDKVHYLENESDKERAMVIWVTCPPNF